MVRTQTKQNGMTLIGFVIILVILLSLVYVAFKLVPHYINDYSVRTSMASLVEESRGEVLSVSAARGRLLQKLDVNFISSIKTEHIKITRASGGGLLMTVEYQVRESIAGNVDACMLFKHSVTLNDRS